MVVSLLCTEAFCCVSFVDTDCIMSAQVERCTTHCKHDWKKCPFSHPTENARRRDPRVHNYIPESCPNYKELGACSWGA